MRATADPGLPRRIAFLVPLRLDATGGSFLFVQADSLRKVDVSGEESGKRGRQSVEIHPPDVNLT